METREIQLISNFLIRRLKIGIFPNPQTIGNAIFNFHFQRAHVPFLPFPSRHGVSRQSVGGPQKIISLGPIQPTGDTSNHPSRLDGHLSSVQSAQEFFRFTTVGEKGFRMMLIPKRTKDKNYQKIV